MSKGKKWIACVLSFFVLVVALVIAFSPFKKHAGSTDRSIQFSINIDASAAKIYEYLGNSENASQWSSFVDHIVPLNADSIADGKQGSKRRCFEKADTSGMRWDEEIVLDETNQRRRLTIFNCINFPMQATGLATEQIYTPIDSAHTQLTFSVFYLQEPNWEDWFQTCVAAYKIKPIFENNLSNIKQIIETSNQ